MISLWIVNRLTLSCAVNAVNNRVGDDDRCDILCCRIVGKRTQKQGWKASVSDSIPLLACESEVGTWTCICV